MTGGFHNITPGHLKLHLVDSSKIWRGGGSIKTCIAFDESQHGVAL